MYGWFVQRKELEVTAIHESTNDIKSINLVSQKALDNFAKYGKTDVSAEEEAAEKEKKRLEEEARLKEEQAAALKESE